MTAREYKVGEPVEVSDRGRWIRAKVKERASRGCFITTPHGDRFVHYSNLRPLPVSLVTTIGEAARPAPEQRPKPIPHRSAAAAATPAPYTPPAAPPPTLPRPAPAVSLRRNEFQPTRIGEAMRQARVLLRLTQEHFAEKLKVNYSTISRIELGQLLPDDSMLLLLHELTGQALEDLEQRRAADSAEHEAPPIYVGRAAAPPPRKPAGDLLEHYERVRAIVATPTDPEGRAKWIAAADILWSLRGAP